MTNPFLQSAPRIIDAGDVPISPLSLERRKEMWSACGLIPSLTCISKLFARLDLSVVTNSWGDVEGDFVADVPDPFGRALRDHLSRGHLVLTQQAMVQCAKEIVEFTDTDSDVEIGKVDLLSALMSVNREQNVSATPTATRWEEVLDQITVSMIAQQSFNHSDPLEFLLSAANATWRKPWSSISDPRLIRDLGSGPADVFSETMGVALDDFLALGWVFYNMSRHEGMNRFQPEVLRQFGIGQDVIEVFVTRCSLPLDKLRQVLGAQRGDPSTTPWTRYQLQQYPFVQLPDGSLIAVRFQYAIQRIFGDHPYLETKYLVSEADKKRGDRFRSAMDDVFESRVGEVLDRISGYEGPGGGGVLITERQLKLAWHTKKRKEKICDFAYVRGEHCLLIDANNRHLMKKFAEGSGSVEEFSSEAMEMFAKTKFKQLTSTIRQFRTHGWNRHGAVINRASRFIPLVVAPDAGIPSNEITEYHIMQNAMPLVSEFNDTDHWALPPTIISWRDLLILDGLAQNGVDIFELLVRWRTLSRSGMDIACSLRTYIEQRTNHRPVLSRHEHLEGFDFFELLRRHAAQLNIDQLPPPMRARARGIVDEVALHEVCDNPICVRASSEALGRPHVVLGTQAQNLAGMGAKGRGGGRGQTWHWYGPDRAARAARSRALREAVRGGWDDDAVQAALLHTDTPTLF